MKKTTLLSLGITCSLSTLFFEPAYAAPENCPKEAIHCVYNTADSSTSKWIKATMLPQNLTMVVCMNKDAVLYLEKDDVKMDKLKPGSTLIWQLSQCFDEHCTQEQSLGTDQFTLLKEAKRYTAEPPTYGFTLDPNYGENCQFPIKKLMINPS
jgi:hypothetical protein